MILTGCSLPFGNDEKEEAMRFIDQNASVMAASNDIETKLIAQLKEAEANEFTFEKIAIDVRASKEMQAALYQNVAKETVKGENKQLKEEYLAFLHQREASYTVLLNAISKKDYNTLSFVVAEHETKDQQLQKKTLAKVNQVLTTHDEKERKQLDEVSKKEK